MCMPLRARGAMSLGSLQGLRFGQITMKTFAVFFFLQGDTEQTLVRVFAFSCYFVLCAVLNASGCGRMAW